MISVQAIAESSCASQPRKIAAAEITQPALRHDAPLSGVHDRSGAVSGQPLSTATQTALKTLPETALRHIEANKNSLGAIVNGWIMTKDLGVYGTNYTKRAVVAAYGWPANLEKDAIYPYTEVDSKGRTLSGTNKYTVTFAEGTNTARRWLLVDHDV